MKEMKMKTTIRTLFLAAFLLISAGTTVELAGQAKAAFG
jgi:hypothetical protein